MVMDDGDCVCGEENGVLRGCDSECMCGEGGVRGKR